MVEFIEYKGEYIRSKIASDKSSVYIFTDNWNRNSGNNPIKPKSNYFIKYSNGKMLNYPNKTQAVLRGLDNCFPISTMQNQFKTQITDDYLYKFTDILRNEIDDIISYVESNNITKVYYVGSIGCGTYSNMPKYAPKCYLVLLRNLDKLKKRLESLHIDDNEIDFEINL